jgi:hypothetical protein
MKGKFEVVTNGSSFSIPGPSPKLQGSDGEI